MDKQQVHGRRIGDQMCLFQPCAICKLDFKGPRAKRAAKLSLPDSVNPVHESDLRNQNVKRPQGEVTEEEVIWLQN